MAHSRAFGWVQNAFAAAIHLTPVVTILYRPCWTAGPTQTKARSTMGDNSRFTNIMLITSVVMIGAYFTLDYFFPEQLRDPETSTEVAADADVTAGNQPAPAQVVAPVQAAPTLRALTPDERAAREAEAETFTLRTDDFVATFSDADTALRSFTLSHERFEDPESGEAENLVTTNRDPYWPLAISFEGLNIDPLATWEGEQISDNEIQFRHVGDGFSIERRFETDPAAYKIWSTVTLLNQADYPRNVRLIAKTAHWVRGEQASGGLFDARSPYITFGLCHSNGELEREDAATLAENAHGFGAPIEFTGLTNTYFATLMAPEGSAASRCGLYATPTDGHVFESSLFYGAQDIAPGESATFRTAIFVGPKDPDTLSAFGHNARSAVDLGWFSFIGEGFVALLRFIHGFVGNWGLAIILLTVCVRMALYPLTAASFRSMAKMRMLKPQMDDINARHKDDAEKRGAAIMELYRKEKVNPLFGCLPAIVQLPIWFALYQSLSTNIQLYHAPFALWWSDLSAPDPYYILPVLLGGLMFIQQRLTPNTMDPLQQKMIMYGMPIMITFFMLFLPSGLCLYMVTNSVLGIAQQYYVQRKLERLSATPEPAV